VDALLLLTVVLASSALAVVAARGMLSVLFLMMTHPPTLHLHWGRIFFMSALFWFWYYSPKVVETIAAVR
jgi:hypothetical protein